MYGNFKALAILLFICLAGNAQTLAVNENDKAAGSRLITTRNHAGSEHRMEDSVVKNGVVFFAAGYQSSAPSGKTIETYYIDLNIVHNDNRLGCLEQLESHVILTLANGTEIECFQISDSDCSPEAYHASFALMPRGFGQQTMKENFEKLLNTQITAITIVTSESELPFRIKSGKAAYMQKHFALIDKTVKSVVK